MWTLAWLGHLALGFLAFRRVRWAYVLFIALALAYFPLKAGFPLEPRACQLLFDARLAAFSLTNWAHIVLFAVFFLMSYVQFSGGARSSGTALLLAAAATLAMGVAVEIAQGLTGRGNCRARDLIPDSAGIALCAAGVTFWRAARRWAATGSLW